MDIGRSFTFVFEDEDWLKKVLIGGGLSIIPVVGQLFTIGYGLEVARRVAKGDPQPLPEWGDWGGLLKDGFMAMVIGIVWMLPIIVVSSCAWIPAILSGVISPTTSAMLNSK